MTFLKIEEEPLYGRFWVIAEGRMIIRPRPALARKVAAWNPGFSRSTIQGHPSECGPCAAFA
jgi:hypothetical protein